LYYGPFHPLLSDHEHFPYLYQISPNKPAMMALVIHLGWNWVGLVISDDDPGIQFLSELKGEMHKHRVCLAFVNIITENIQLHQKTAEKYYNQIMLSSAKVIIIYGDTDSTLSVYFRIWQHLDIQRLWITTSQWDMNTSKGDFLQSPFHGTLILSHHHSEISGFKKFIQTIHPSNYNKDTSIARLWWMYFNCSLSSHCKTLKNCSTKILLEWLSRHNFEVSMRETSYNLDNAVYVVAYALHEMLVQQILTLPKNTEKGKEFYSWQMAPFLNNNQFINPSGDHIVNHKGKLDREYDILYITNFLPSLVLKMKIGKFSKHVPHSQQLYMTEDMMDWVMDIRQMSGLSYDALHVT
ncbi:vomeronasal type-2 receptor, partial [Cricetulus griseus]